MNVSIAGVRPQSIEVLTMNPSIRPSNLLRPDFNRGGLIGVVVDQRHGR